MAFQDCEQVCSQDWNLNNEYNYDSSIFQKNIFTSATYGQRNYGCYNDSDSDSMFTFPDELQDDPVQDDPVQDDPVQDDPVQDDPDEFPDDEDMNPIIEIQKYETRYRAESDIDKYKHQIDKLVEKLQQMDKEMLEKMDVFIECLLNEEE